jgi:hypothetical protein
MSNNSRNFAAEKTFVDAWRASGRTFTRNARSDRMKKFLEGTRENPDLVENLEPFIGEAVSVAAQNGHDQAFEATHGLRLAGSATSSDLILRFHLNNKWVKHPRPTPDSKPGVWFGSTKTAAWYQNTKELWGGEEGGLMRKHLKDGHKTWESLRGSDKAAADNLITLMRDALFAECSDLTIAGVSEFIKYLGLGENTLHITLFESSSKIEAETFGPVPVAGTPVIAQKISHDRITLQCGDWEFALRVHSADLALKPSSFKVEVDVPSHP